MTSNNNKPARDWFKDYPYKEELFVGLFAASFTAALVATEISFTEKSPQQFALASPIECRVGETCFVQNYVDVDPSAAARDHKCLDLTYDGHNGTDFRLPDQSYMRAGVRILAAAGGVVRGRRDGEKDALYLSLGETAVTGKECGNGARIEHADGWETQYCHLREGSILVTEGSSIKAGDPIGLVGLSGSTEFPHLHFVVRRDRTVIDPFTGATTDQGCNADPSSLWERSLGLTHEAVAVINQGFTDVSPTMDGVEDARYEKLDLDRQSPLLVYFVRIIGLRNGDVYELNIRAPDGRQLVHNEASHDGTSKAQFFQFVGKKRPAGGWSSGTYEGDFRLRRSGQLVLQESLEIEIKR